MFCVGGGVLGLGVTVRMKGIFATTNPLSRFFFLRLGVAPIFLVFFFASFGPQAVERKSLWAEICKKILKN